MAQTCGNCFYWRPVDGDFEECRRYPPQFCTESDAGVVSGSTAFPNADTDHWCGEWMSNAE